MKNGEGFENNSIFWVEVHKIHPNPYQPRREFDEERLRELSDSILQYGILQPLVVTRKETHKEDGGLLVEYELIAGERRLRASRLAGVSQVPVIIRSGAESDRMKLELAIIENLQREDLNPVDRAHAFKQLAEQFSLSHAQVAAKIGRSREYVSNTLRLLNLPEEMLLSIQTGAMTEGHGRSLLMLSDRSVEQNTLYREILLKKLSVREVERISRKIAVDKVRKKEWGIDQELLAIEQQLTESLGTRVQIARTEFGGKVVIDYFAPEDLHKLLMLVSEERARSGWSGMLAEAPMVDPEPTTPSQAVPETIPDIGSESVSEAAMEEVAGVMPNVPETPAPETLVDDRPPTDRKTEDDTDLYDIKNFSL